MAYNGTMRRGERVLSTPAAPDHNPSSKETGMAEQQPITDRPFFQPLPEHDNLNTAYFLAMFAQRVRVLANGCWEWTGTKVGAGYGRVCFGGRHQLSHRLVYRLCVAPVTKTQEVCHNCPGGDNPACCNPAHLWVGTHTDNMRDCEAKGRNSHPGRRGEQSGTAKLTEVDVREIRRRVAAGENGRVIAEEKGISRTTVSQIANRLRWGHLS